MTKEEKSLVAEFERVLMRTVVSRLDAIIAAMDERAKRWAAEDANLASRGR